MQTKLRIFGFVIVASLLWISPTSAASIGVKAQNKSKGFKIQYLGTASWYGEQHQDKKMANGKPFNRHNLTAASWYFPLGTTLRVVNVQNGKSVVVTVTDRGPNLRLHRILDLSEAAANKLDYTRQGLTPVFLYPMLRLDIQWAKFDSRLIEPSFRKAPAGVYEAAALPPTM